MVFNPDPNSYVQGNLTSRPSDELPMGSAAWMGAMDREASEARTRDKLETSNNASGPGSGGNPLVLLAIFIVALIPASLVFQITTPFCDYQSLDPLGWAILAYIISGVGLSILLMLLFHAPDKTRR